MTQNNIQSFNQYSPITMLILCKSMVSDPNERKDCGRRFIHQGQCKTRDPRQEGSGPVGRLRQQPSATDVVGDRTQGPSGKFRGKLFVLKSYKGLSMLNKGLICFFFLLFFFWLYTNSRQTCKNTLITDKNLKVLPINIYNIQHMHTMSL